MAQEQQHPATEQQLPSDEASPAASPQNVDLKKATAREDLANLTSGAKEKMDKTFAGMKGAAHMWAHPFNKQAKEDAKTKTAERKKEIGQKQQSIRETAQIQLMEQKAIADGVDPATVLRPAPGPPPSEGAQLDHEKDTDSAMREPENDTDPSSGEPINETEMREPENVTEPSSGEPINETQTSGTEDKMAEESSDSSSRGPAAALNQIPPDSKDYQSG